MSIIDIWQGSECVQSSEYACVIQGSLENGLSYSSDSQYTKAYYTRAYYLNIQDLWIFQGYTGLYVNCILKVHDILNFLSFEYAKVLNVSGV